MDGINHGHFKDVIAEITALQWTTLSPEELTAVAWAYHSFSIQFRENLQTALALFPDDEKLRHLTAEECDTANLSPWPGVAEEGERMNHDEFMRRTLDLSPISPVTASIARQVGEAYLQHVRSLPPEAKALSIASYEDGGLEATFRAMLSAPNWNTPLLQAFQHFLIEHIRFDSDPEAGHGALSRHLQPDDRVLPFWEAFRDLLLQTVPSLGHGEMRRAG